jgi:hypothetical protein
VTQDGHSRVQRIKGYVLARLREELSSAPRGAQAQLAKELGVSGAHLSNMLSRNPTRQPGESFRRKVAAHWGITYAQLEAAAFGEAPVESQAPGWSDRVTPASLRVVLEAYAWMPELPPALRTVVREQAKDHHRYGGADFPAEEWQRIVTGLEREALAWVARGGLARSTAPARPASGIEVRRPKKRDVAR